METPSNEEFVEWARGLPSMESRFDWRQEESWRRFVDERSARLPRR